jgi:hypothetical protein
MESVSHEKPGKTRRRRRLLREVGGDRRVGKDDRELVIRLCTIAGTLMEDASVVPITSAGIDEMQLDLAAELLGRYADQMKN